MIRFEFAQAGKLSFANIFSSLGPHSIGGGAGASGLWLRTQCIPFCAIPFFCAWLRDSFKICCCCFTRKVPRHQRKIINKVADSLPDSASIELDDARRELGPLEREYRRGQHHCFGMLSSASMQWICSTQCIWH